MSGKFGIMKTTILSGIHYAAMGAARRQAVASVLFDTRRLLPLAMKNFRADRPLKHVEIGINFVDKEAITDVNFDEYGEAAPTDVLTFPCPREMAEGIPLPIQALNSVAETMGLEFTAKPTSVIDLERPKNAFEKVPSPKPLSNDQVDQDMPSFAKKAFENMTTDELDMLEANSGVFLGDIMICLDTAQKQANERNHSLHDELRVLMTHGILHCLEYDHEISEEDHDEMASHEQYLFNEMGWRNCQGGELLGLCEAASRKSISE